MRRIQINMRDLLVTYLPMVLERSAQFPSVFLEISVIFRQLRQRASLSLHLYPSCNPASGILVSPAYKWDASISSSRRGKKNRGMVYTGVSE